MTSLENLTSGPRARLAISGPQRKEPEMCNSGKYHETVYDARGIYVGKVCEDCEKQALAPYRPEIFTDPNYETDEPVEPEGE